MINIKNPLPENIYIHESAAILGDVEIGEFCSFWPNVVIRADLNVIKIGKYVNIQDNSVLHVDSDSSIEIGDYTLIGHMAMLHGCKIGKACMIGIRTLILDDAEIGDGSMITANCVIRGKMKIPPFSLVTQKNGELKIYPDKAKTFYTVMASLEYWELAKRYQNQRLEKITKEEWKELELKAKEVLKELFP